MGVDRAAYGFGAAGLVLGLATTFVGTPFSLEAPLWMLAYAILGAAMARRRVAHPVRTAVVGGLVAHGIAAGITVFALEQWLDAHPQHAPAGGDPSGLIVGMVATAVASGAFFGVVTGLTARVWIANRGDAGEEARA
ncbi:MAG TPA: hypothetical protein RMH85_24940 [Polyangiaceae bacterium LLY-WYZ-15_(1-7)]|nr:hypothetical protein [Polyangiaceae bacterium LLY-WYZ-15_(1-7)]HJL11746.1 hypothetical protein [Polyangiaceae bacterium LLY-WYZ-15_(1-7)]HJL22944.1 hypothetical protein [Polyangiaceae bacterium LLY-WYZ-15_(1-7)]HJL30883.1 hypothetical protein [Polyangiaceae bacterium LLY-WYZ-15_(1-7)]HJL39301.1 hypothetical protein [Polyangiaceae bacterium LLY-WYZ-15_(1-7)]